LGNKLFPCRRLLLLWGLLVLIGFQSEAHFAFISSIWVPECTMTAWPIIIICIDTWSWLWFFFSNWDHLLFFFGNWDHLWFILNNWDHLWFFLNNWVHFLSNLSLLFRIICLSFLSPEYWSISDQGTPLITDSAPINILFMFLITFALPSLCNWLHRRFCGCWFLFIDWLWLIVFKNVLIFFSFKLCEYWWFFFYFLLVNQIFLFLRDIVRHITLRQYEGLSLDDILDFGLYFRVIVEALPINRETKKMPRQYISNMIYMLMG